MLKRLKKISFIFLLSIGFSVGFSGCSNAGETAVDTAVSPSTSGLDTDETCQRILDLKVNGPKLVGEGESQYEYVWQPASETRASEFDDLWDDLRAIRSETTDHELDEYLSSWMQVTETRAQLLRTNHDLGDVLAWMDSETGIVGEEAKMVDLNDTYQDRC